MPGRRLVIPVVLVLLLAAAPARATDRFVATGGSDGDPCTAVQPCLTVQRALDVAAAGGDRVVIGAGTFGGHAASAKQVELVGAGATGPGATVLVGDDANATLTLQGGGGVSAMTIRAATGGGLVLTSTNASGPALAYAVSHVGVEGPLAGCGVICTVPALTVAPDGAVPTRTVAATIEHATVTTGAGFGVETNFPGGSALLRDVAVTASHGTAQSILFVNGADGSVSDSSISGTGNGFDLAGQGDPVDVTLTRVRVDVAGQALFVVIGRASVVDSLLVSRNGSAALAQALGSGPGTDLVLRGVTLYAEGTTGTRALQLFQGAGVAVPTAELTNTLVRAVQGAGGTAPADVEAHGAGALVSASHSAFTTTLLTGGAPAGAIPPAGSGTNVSGDPGLLAPALPTADFRLAASSPLIDRGDPAAATAGETDLVGAPRALDGDGNCTAIPDVGAFEAPAAAAAGCGGGGPGADTTPPTLGGVSFSPATFRVVPARRRSHGGRRHARHAARAAARKRHARAHRRGSRLKATVSEAGTLEVSLVRCTNRSCTRTKAAGTLRLVVRAGRNALSFSGRVGGRALRVGRYRASVRARDAAGNRSPARTASFAIVAR